MQRQIKLKSRQTEMLEMLIAAGTPIDISTLTAKFNKSERTVRYDLLLLKSMLSSLGIEIKNKTKQGFYIPVSQKITCAEIISKNIVLENTTLTNEKENLRKNLLLFMISQQKPLSIEEIANKLFVSRSTCMKMITQFNEKSSNFSYLPNKAHKYELIGNEFEIRKEVSVILASYFDGSYVAEDWYLLLPEVLKNSVDLDSIDLITNSIKKLNAKYNIWISNNAYLNLLCYCITKEIRCKSTRIMVLNEASTSSLNDNQEVTYAAELIKKISPNDSVNPDEYNWLQEVMISNGIIISSKDVNQNSLLRSIDKMLEIIKKEGKNRQFEFDYEALRKDLYSHLLLYLKIVSYEVKREDNIVLYEMKTKYKNFFEMAKHCIQPFEDEFQLEMVESEICYIAIYLYKNLVNEETHSKNILIVCATGKGLSNLITTRIKNVFPNLNVMGQSSPYAIEEVSRNKKIDSLYRQFP